MKQNDKINGKKILVTGGAGFIGSNLIEALLSQNNQVTCLDNFSTGFRQNIEPFLNNADFRLIEGDIRERETCATACDGVDYVLHQAALGSVPRSLKDPVTTIEVNIGGFTQMLWAAKNAGVKRFVYAASSSTYGDSTELPKRENCIGKPLSPYAVSKYVDELIAENFSSVYGIKTIGLRYFNVFGRRQSPTGAYAAVIPLFAAALLNHQSPKINGDGSYSRDFTYIDNVIQANQLAALTENPKALNTVYNVAFGEQHSLNDLFELLRNHLSVFDSKIAEVRAEYVENRLGDIPHSLADISKARKLLGYNPQFDFKSGLAEASNWYVKTLCPTG